MLTLLFAVDHRLVVDELKYFEGDTIFNPQFVEAPYGQSTQPAPIEIQVVEQKNK